jgi:ABC-type glycerol-3-phosphate transport system permease component
MARETGRWWQKRSSRVLFARISAFTVILLGAVFQLIPFAWMLSSSLKDLGSVYLFPPQWIPKPLIWENYVDVWMAAPFLRFFLNTSLITLSRIIGAIFSCSLVAFGFARLRAPGRNVLFLVVLSTMMVPFHVTMIPLYLIFNSLKWIDTFAPLIVPYFFGTAFYIFLLRQFFMGIPLEMDDSARIDGCSLLGIYWRIVLPMAVPALAAVSIFTFMWSWNEFIGPLIYLQSTEKYTLSLGLNFFRNAGSGYGVTEWNLLMAASIIVLLPCIVVFFLAQRTFIQGVVVSGVKG